MPGEAAGSSSSSSSSSSSNSGSGDTPDTSTPTPTRRRLPKVKNLQTPDERVDEDLNVAKFYLNRGNFNAAYLRSKDAVKTEPDYAETHFSLAQAAQKMNKSDEAKAEYNAYLKLSPGGDNAKAARKALEELH
jgi:Tfp pilus assembly protein PilF